MVQLQILTAVFVALPFLVFGEQCLSPSVQSKTYTSSDLLMSREAVAVIEFSVTCKNGPADMNFYAEFNGKIYPASKQLSKDSNNYQVSFSDEYRNFPSGTHQIRFFDEEAYADLKKAQRSAEDTTAIKSVFSIDVHNQGLSRGMIVQTEFITALIAILVWYLAYNARTNIKVSKN